MKAAEEEEERGDVTKTLHRFRVLKGLKLRR